MTYLLFDLAVVIILVLFLLRGAQRGLVLSLCGLVAVFVALIGAQVASDVLAPKVADVLEPGFSSVIEEQLSDKLTLLAELHRIAEEYGRTEQATDILLLFDYLFGDSATAEEELMTDPGLNA